MKLLLVALLLAAGSGVASGLTREYIYNNYEVSWNKAQTICREKYRDLATITNKEENNQLFVAGPGQSIWIGLHKTSADNNWKWSDGEPVTFLDWYYVIEQNECASTYPSSYYLYSKKLWLSRFCGTSLSFYCYQYLILVKENKTWEEALEFCRSKYTSLAFVSSESSLKQMKLEMAATETDSVWTGLHFVYRKWLWVKEVQPGYQSGSQLGDLTLMPSCPAPSYHCGAFNTVKLTFENYNCNKKMNFICYWK